MKISFSLLLLILSSAADVSAFSAPSTPASVPASASVVAKGSSSAQEMSALTANVKTIFTSEDIDRILPHRYPFALVDKVVEYEAGKRAVGIKSVTKVRCVLFVVACVQTHMSHVCVCVYVRFVLRAQDRNDTQQNQRLAL